jgi:hypothetical protein
MGIVPESRVRRVMEIPALGGYGLPFNGPVLILFQKIFSGTGILPVRVHRLKTCATNFK